jgi:hypothetical protein
VNNRRSSGLGFPEVLTTIFLVLKLTHLINWSWWWIFSPLLILIPLAMLVVWLKLD